MQRSILNVIKLFNANKYLHVLEYFKTGLDSLILLYYKEHIFFKKCISLIEVF